jgi:hypothetical protein
VGEGVVRFAFEDDAELQLGGAQLGGGEEGAGTQ